MCVPKECSEYYDSETCDGQACPGSDAYCKFVHGNCICCEEQDCSDGFVWDEITCLCEEEPTHPCDYYMDRESCEDHICVAGNTSCEWISEDYDDDHDYDDDDDDDDDDDGDYDQKDYGDDYKSKLNSKDDSCSGSGGHCACCAEKECKEGYTWSSRKCKCEKKQKCSKHKSEESCTANICKDSGNPCSWKPYKNGEKYKCKCCDENECSSSKSWNSETCECESPPKKEYCQTHATKSECEMNICKKSDGPCSWILDKYGTAYECACCKPKDCCGSKTWSNQTCKCESKKYCKQYYSEEECANNTCKKSEGPCKWSAGKCSCCPVDNECKKNKYWNAESCECEDPPICCSFFTSQVCI